LLPHALALFCRKIDSLPEQPFVHAHAGNGVVFGHFAPTLALERARVILEGLGSDAHAAQGNVVVRRCPTAWKQRLPIWGKERDDFWLMRQIKGQLDPNGLFNPGRFLATM